MKGISIIQQIIMPAAMFPYNLFISFEYIISNYIIAIMVNKYICHFFITIHFSAEYNIIIQTNYRNFRVQDFSFRKIIIC